MEMNRKQPGFSESDALRHIDFLRVTPEAFKIILQSVRAYPFAGSMTSEDKEFVEKNPDVNAWLKHIGFSSREIYLVNMVYYTKCTKLNPSALLDLKLSEDPKIRYYPAERLMENWIDLAEKAKLSNSRIFNVLASVRSFYLHNWVPLRRIYHTYCPPEKPEFDESNLLKFREGFDFWGKPLFDFLLAVPLRDGQFQRCPHCNTDFFPRWRHIITYPKIVPYSPFVIRPFKEHEKPRKKLMQVCFLSASAALGLNTMRSQRENELGRPLLRDEFIFTHHVNSRKGIMNITPFGKANIYGIFRRAGINTGERGITPHRLRDWDNAILSTRGIDKQIRDIYLGHSTAYEMRYILQMVPKWRTTLIKAKALEHMDVVPPPPKLDKIKELVERLDLTEDEFELFKKILKKGKDAGLI